MPERHAPQKSQIRSVALLLIDDFALMSYASIVEPFRAANTLAGIPLYRWRHLSVDGAPVRASNGASIMADERVGERLDYDLLVVVAGGDPASFENPATFAWLRRLAVKGVHIAGVSGGPFILAKAGLLDGHAATIHWDHQIAFRDRFPHLLLEPGLYVIDRRRITCAGGTAGLDLAIELIERDHGHALAAKVSEWFIRTELREGGRSQRLGLRERRGVKDDRVLKVLARMEASVEEPISREVLAQLVGLSIRQIERLFRWQLGQGMNEAYRDIRLDQARALLRKTGMPAIEAMIACGFKSSSHFSSAYKRKFGKPPSMDRV
jgi:transcriptional regulator GlxA family with amidase domain